MKSKMVSIIICTVLVAVANIFAPITQNIGQSSSSSSETGGLMNSPWPMFRHNLNHTGLSPYDTSTNNGQLKWSFTTNHNMISSPAIGSDGTIYVGSNDYNLYAIHPDGTEKWSFTTGQQVWSSPAIGSDGTIYVGSNDNRLYAINSDGTEKWNFTTGGSIYSSPAISVDGTIYVGSLDNKLYAINPDGTEKWSFTTSWQVISSPAIGLDGTIYIGSNDNKLYAINPNGTLKWNFTTGGPVHSSPAIGFDKTIYVGSGDYKIYAINSDGALKWSYTTGVNVESSPAIGLNETIYIGSEDNKLYAINPDGTEKWSFITGNVMSSSPAISFDGTIYVGSDDNKLYAINPDGTEKWSFTTGGKVESSPAIGSNGTIYVGSNDNKLYAIGKASTPPMADAGPDQNVNEGDIVQFMGCNSTGSTNGDPSSVDPNIVALWHMDEGSGSTIYDETPNNNDGTINGPTWTTGKFGSALKFEDTDLVYEIPASFDDYITTSITVVAWVYWEGPHPGTYSPNSYIIDARDFEGMRGGFILYLDPNGTLIFLLLYGNNVGDYQIVQSTCKVPIKRWTHIAGVLDYTNGELRLYINGNEDTSVPATDPYHDFGGSHWDVAIGNNRYAPGDKKWVPFNGIIDEVVIYNTALTNQELPSTPAKIISYKWDFDDSDGIDWDNPDVTGPTPTHVYGDDGVYTVTLNITDETGGTATDTCNITVLNVAPTVDLNGPHSSGEGSPITFTSTATDSGSDDLTFTWKWGDGTSIKSIIHYNDGIGPDPIYDPATNEIKSPWGIYPFNITYTVNHTYGDNGIYTITLTVDDDDNGTTVIKINVTVNNVAPNITLLIVPSDYEGSQLTFEAEAIDPGSDDLTFSWEFEYGPTIENIYYNDGVGPEPIYDPNTNEVKSPGGTSPFNVSDTVTHTYGDNYDYFLTLRVKDDDDGMTVINTTIAVDNIAPSITKFAIPLDLFEGSKTTFQAAAKDLGSDDLTFTWEFEQGPSITNTYYNDGMSPDPYPSPWGNFSFIAQDTVDHIFGDNGEFYVMLIVTDDDNDPTTFNTTVTVNNVAPKVDALPNATIDEGGIVTLTGHAIDPGSDDLTFTWSWEYAPWGDKSTIYYNDGMGPDPFPSPSFNPRNITEDATCQYGDDGVFIVTLTVSDDDDDSTIVTTNITVNNVAPTVTIESITMDVEIGLRVAGRKYNKVNMTLYEDRNPIGYSSIERMPGSPNDQMAWIPVTLDMTKTYSATVIFTPEDPPNVGAIPVWIYVKFENETVKKIHHTFNVQQSKKRDSDHWNHVEPWEVDLNAHLIGLQFEITSHIIDPGSDDETLTFTYCSQIVTVTCLNDPPNLDLYPSPEVKPMGIIETITLLYEGPGTVTLVVKDDDNIRLGVGQSSDSFDVI